MIWPKLRGPPYCKQGLDKWWPSAYIWHLSKALVWPRTSIHVALMTESSAQTFPESISTHVNIPSGSDVFQEIALPMISGYSSSHVSMWWVRKKHGLMRLIPLACLSGQQLSSTFCRKILNDAFIFLKQGNKRTAWVDSWHCIVILFSPWLWLGG